MLKNLLVFVIGLLFSAGLVVSQMVDPQKVLNFLDLTGHWDPSLALVMGGALCVYWVGFFLLKPRMQTPLCEQHYDLPNKHTVDKSLLFGAVLFGAGWGITGLCPGPAIANVTGADPLILLYLAVMMFSVKAYDGLTQKQ